MTIDPRDFLRPELFAPTRRSEAIEELARLPVSGAWKRRAAIAWARIVGVELHTWELEIVTRGIKS